MDHGSNRKRSSCPHSPAWGRVCRGALLALAVLAPVAFAQENPPAPPADQPVNLADPSAAPSASSVRAVRLTDVEGTVQIFNGDNPVFSQAQPNMPVVEGMRIVTADDGRAEVQFEDGSVARVAPNSSLTLSELRQSGSTTETVLEATSGLTYYELNGQEGEYSIRFANYTAVPNDSGVFRVELDASPAEFSVLQGSAHVTGSKGLDLDVPADHSARLDGLGHSQLADAVSPSSWDQWNLDRDQVLAALDQSATTGRADTGNPNDAAWNDLDYYGDWYDVPGYGMAWTPSGVDASFDPYGQGAWGYYPALGYTWISGYPWGWLPYHCGAWNWFEGNGWMWFPGNCGAVGYGGGGWYAYSTVWHTPPGYRPPMRPRSGPRPPHSPVRGPAISPLITVNRGGEGSQQFRTIGAARPVARVMSYQGTDLHPSAPVLHPQHPGPLGESFGRDVVREQPVIPPPVRSVGGITGGGVQNTVTPSAGAYLSTGTSAFRGAHVASPGANVSPIEPRGSYAAPRGSVSPAPPRFAVPPTIRQAPAPGAPHFSPPPMPHIAAPSAARPR